jgi:hypothetical protein
MGPHGELRLLDTCWELVGRSGTVITCEIYEVGGIDVQLRARRDDNDFIRIRRADNVAAARNLADQWRREALAEGHHSISAGSHEAR